MMPKNKSNRSVLTNYFIPSKRRVWRTEEIPMRGWTIFSFSGPSCLNIFYSSLIIMSTLKRVTVKIGTVDVNIIMNLKQIHLWHTEYSCKWATCEKECQYIPLEKRLSRYLFVSGSPTQFAKQSKRN
jgi:hypothetical protein